MPLVLLGAPPGLRLVAPKELCLRMISLSDLVSVTQSREPCLVQGLPKETETCLQTWKASKP